MTISPTSSRRVPAPILAAAVIVAIVLGALLYKRGIADTAMPTAPAPTESAIAEAASADAYPDLPGAGAPMTPTARDAVAGIVASRRQAQAAITRSGSDLRQAASKAYAAEVRDGAWAAAKEAELRKIVDGAAMTAAGVAADDLSMQCRRTLCEASATFATPGAAEDWVLAYMSSVGSAASSSVVSRDPMPGGGTRITIVSKAR